MAEEPSPRPAVPERDRGAPRAVARRRRRPPLATPFVAPGDDSERRIAEIWQGLLRMERVGADDNFFELGGDSLLAAQLLSQLGQEFAVEPTLRAVFAGPTVAEQAALVAELSGGMAGSGRPTRSPAERAPGPLRHILPNGLEVFCQSRAEADFLYHDIFDRRVYLDHGITLQAPACVFDIGANIGLFSLFVHQECAAAAIYAFEPAPPLAEIFRRNADRHGLNAELFDFGLADERKTARFCFYPNSPGLSSFYPDTDQERQALQELLDYELRAGKAGLEQLMRHSEELLEERLRGEWFECELRTLSEMIRRHRIERIDLIKIDVQKSEFDVLKGIDDEDWNCIQQIVVEVHDLEGGLGRVVSLLETRGYDVTAEQDEPYEGSDMYNVYARR